MITKKIDEHLIRQAARLINAARKVVIVAHMGPDGDAIGSSLAMKHFLDLLDKESVHVIMPNRFPDFLMWMPGAKDIHLFDEAEGECTTLVGEADLVVCLDFNQLSRIGRLHPLVEQSQARKLLIDHHTDPDNFADVSISYPEMSSTSEMVFRLICRMGCFDNMTRDMADCIYTGLMTDTGNFSYSSSDPELYDIVGQLLRLGVDKDDIHNRVYNNYSEYRLRLLGYCLNDKMRIFPAHRTALIALSSQELMRFQFRSGDAEGIVNLPLQIRNVDYSIFLREDKDKIKISFRSKGDLPVNGFAATYFGGGGHKNAAGGESYDTLELTVKRLEELLPQLAARPEV